ncbi:MAG: CoA-binding protein, partial [Gallionella sp.]
SGAGVAASHLLPQSAGYASNVSEVRPMVTEILGEKAFPDLESLPELPDIVDVFRVSEHVPAIVESCIKLGIRNLWLQEGVINEEAAQRAREAGITVVMDRCMWRDYMQFCEHKP